MRATRAGLSRGAEAPALLLSLLLNLGIVYGVGTALQQRPLTFERIEVDLRERVPPPPPPLRLPPRASAAPEVPAPVPLPRPVAVPRRLAPTRAEARPVPRPREAPLPIPVPATAPAPTAVPLHLARQEPTAQVPATPAQASVSPPSPAPPVPSALPAPPSRVALRVDLGALEAYQAQIRARIEAEKRYPRWARKARIQGRTTVGFRLDPAGTLLETAIRESSGNDALDRAALSAVQRAAPYPPCPEEAGLMPSDFEVTVAFVLQ